MNAGNRMATDVKHVLVVEEEPHVMARYKRFLKAYEPRIKPAFARDVAEAMRRLESQTPHLLILDVMLPYGEGPAAASLRPEDDETFVETGRKLLEWIRGEEAKLNRDALWTVVVTARTEPALLDELERLLNGSGRVFTKPVEELLLEVVICDALGITCRLDVALVDQIRAEDRENGWLPWTA